MAANRPLRGRAPAKINLGLEVIGRRPDGYHELRSVFLRLALADDLLVRAVGRPPTDDPGADTLLVAGPRPTDDPAEDLILRAAVLLRSQAQRALPPLAFELVKRVPVAGGLGGGSSDAAAALRLAARAWALSLTRQARLEMAARLGSDVPFFAAGWRAAWVEGRGERLTRLETAGRLGVLLVRPDVRLSTREVFAAYDRLPRPTGRDRRAPLPSLVSGERPDPAALAAGLRDRNDLWAAALAVWPDLGQLRAALEARLGRPILMTGSGPTLVALYPSSEEARQAARALDLSDAAVVVTRSA
jgi:4-diphosphocytidyl-2-C-methyl-D-erythritol kinase